MSNGEGDVVLDGTWMCFGWQFVLPQQATALHMLVATATDQDLDGSLDELVEDLGVVWFDYFTDGLDFPVRWTHPIDAREGVEADAGERAGPEPWRPSPSRRPDLGPRLAPCHLGLLARRHRLRPDNAPR